MTAMPCAAYSTCTVQCTVHVQYVAREQGTRSTLAIAQAAQRAAPVKVVNVTDV